MPHAGIYGRWPPAGAGPGPYYVMAVTSEPGKLSLRTLTLRVDLQIQVFYCYLSTNVTIIIQFQIEPKTEWVSRDIKKISC